MADGLLAETDLARPMSGLSVKADVHLDKAPTMNELKLGQRVLKLEKERDAMSVPIDDSHRWIGKAEIVG